VESDQPLAQTDPGLPPVRLTPPPPHTRKRPQSVKTSITGMIYVINVVVMTCINSRKCLITKGKSDKTIVILMNNGAIQVVTKFQS
jgi:hypothetical protein